MELSSGMQRLITGLILAAIFGAAVFLGGWAAHLLIFAAAMAGLIEFYQMFWPGREKIFVKIVGIFCGAGFVLCSQAAFAWSIFFLALSFCLVALLFLYDFGTGNTEAKITDNMLLPVGIIYIPLLLCLALSLSPAEQVLVVLTAIGTDAGGYYAGSAFGKHKLWPAVSPKKTWEGSVGGALATMLICVTMGLLQGTMGFGLPALPFWMWALIGILLNVAAQTGDFFESALKRSQGIKDSGAILPGHGGCLDRIDSLLFVLPAYSFVRLVYNAVQALAAPPL